MTGPNVKKLIIRKMSLLMVPPGGGAEDVIRSLTTPGKIAEVGRQAREWVAEAIAAVRKAAEPNPWKTADDEVIAEEILRVIEERKAARPSP